MYHIYLFFSNIYGSFISLVKNLKFTFFVFLLKFKKLNLLALHMLKRTHFLKNDEIFKNIMNILNNKKFSITKYGIKPSYIIEKLEKKSKIQLSSAKKIKNVYNDFYKTNFKIDELFNLKMLINYEIEYKLDFHFLWKGNLNLKEWIRIILWSDIMLPWNKENDLEPTIITIHFWKIIFYLILLILIILFWNFLYHLIF